MENNMLCARLMIHTIYGFSLPADIFPFVFTDSEKSTSFVVLCVVKDSLYRYRLKKRIGGKRDLFVWLWRYLLVIIFIL